MTPMPPLGLLPLLALLAEPAELNPQPGDLLWMIEPIDQLSCLINDHESMYIDVALRVPFRVLRNADKRLQFRKDLPYDAEFIKPLEADRRTFRLQQ